MQNDQNLEHAVEVTSAAVIPVETNEITETETVVAQEESSYEEQLRIATRDRAKKDMLYGALWCIGGTVLTLADIGFIFWGAIVFGAVQFFRGLSNYNKA